MIMKSILVRFRAFCVSSFPLVAFALVVSNFIMSFKISKSVHPQYSYRTFVVTNYLHSVVTNFVSSPSSPSFNSTNFSPSAEKPSPPRYDRSYRYFVNASRRMVYMDGSYYSEGDACSKGLIIRIFPDCIYLHDGSVIDNKYSPPLDDSPRFRAPSLSEFKPKRRMKNE